MSNKMYAITIKLRENEMYIANCIPAHNQCVAGNLYLHITICMSLE